MKNMWLFYALSSEIVCIMVHINKNMQGRRSGAAFYVQILHSGDPESTTGHI